MQTPNEKKISNSIKTWNEDDRPREKLMAKGKTTLTDAELLAILIGSGSRETSAVALCQQILEYAHNDLAQLGKLGINDLCKFKGIGPAKAISIIAALELGRRRQSENVQTIQKIESSKDAYRIFLNILADLAHEEFWVLFLNQSNKIIGKEKISSGGVAATVVDNRIVVKWAIERLASGIILVHNHPSGDLKPSRQDKLLTQKLAEAAQLFDIVVLDHLIISSSGYFSFADEALL